MVLVTRGHEVDVSKITHDKLKKRESGAKSVRILYEGDTFRAQLDKVQVPFGLSCYPKEPSEGEARKYSFELSLGGNEKLDRFHDILENIDDMNVQYCADNSKAWWGKSMSADVMKEAETYKSQLKPDLKGENYPRLKVKLSFYEGKPMFKVFDTNKKMLNIAEKQSDGSWKVDWSWATPGMSIKVILDCEGLWVVNKNIYCTWRAVQIQILDKGKSSGEYAFLEDEDEVSIEDGGEPKVTEDAIPQVGEEEEEEEEEEYESGEDE